MTAADLERRFLAGLHDAEDAYEAIVATEAWVDLGHESFAAWWETAVRPAMRALSMRPTREIAAAVVERVRAEESDLPPAQRRTQRELADLAGVHPKTLQRQDRSEGTLSAEADLEPVGEPLPFEDNVPPEPERPRPPKWDPEERRQHELEVRRVQDIQFAHQAAKTIVAEVQALVVTVVTGCRYGEPGLVTPDMIRELRKAIDLLEGELSHAQ